jgi:hypothetical protein
MWLLYRAEKEQLESGSCTKVALTYAHWQLSSRRSLYVLYMSRNINRIKKTIMNERCVRSGYTSTPQLSPGPNAMKGWASARSIPVPPLVGHGNSEFPGLSALFHRVSFDRVWEFATNHVGLAVLGFAVILVTRYVRRCTTARSVRTARKRSRRMVAPCAAPMASRCWCAWHDIPHWPHCVCCRAWHNTPRWRVRTGACPSGIVCSRPTTTRGTKRRTA